ncbi:uracil-DNA glycosylase [Candidatus Comchoanobacter bicostacola]|uniref:Uracil-DNA glycosylase n=1 Tax=Candidatus Comchoanobacter bicostacola TaxID=2919598 RepID=A0ABY5DLM8_9GAMM|nr:uracil-DNA glycosylase [Candidatus Comchoanobacter bicostacola]
MNNDWKAFLESAQNQAYFKQILQTIAQEKENGMRIYPPENQRFQALESTPIHETKVVILGQDPYHQAGQAHGLAFSVTNHTAPPPSLRNILKEMQDDIGLSPISQSPDLTRVAKQGVLLLNTTLSVRHGEPGSHAKIGWEKLTDQIIEVLNSQCEHLVFILWGNHARKKSRLIRKNHLIIESAHPSPLSAHRGFFGSKPFSRTNDWLSKHGKEPIDW